MGRARTPHGNHPGDFHLDWGLPFPHLPDNETNRDDVEDHSVMSLVFCLCPCSDAEMLETHFHTLTRSLSGDRRLLLVDR